MADSPVIPLGLPSWEELNRRCNQLSLAVNQLRSNERTHSFTKAAAVNFLGNLTIIDSYNVISVSNPGIGQYDIEVDQVTIGGVSIGSNFYPNVSVIAPGAEVDVIVSFEGITPPSTVNLLVKEFYLGGTNLRIQPYNLAPTEEVSFTGFLNYIDPQAEPLPS